MTLEEKAHLLVGVKSAEGMDIIANGAGTTYAIPRLGITHTIMMDGATGVRMDTLVRGDGKAYYSTGFPVATLLAATWNTDLVKQRGCHNGRRTACLRWRHPVGSESQCTSQPAQWPQLRVLL